jgi:hypothetical protein
MVSTGVGVSPKSAMNDPAKNNDIGAEGSIESLVKSE